VTDRDTLLGLGEHPKDADRVLARQAADDDTPPPEPMRYAPGEITGDGS
jgi:hypothetical protein